MLIMQALIIFSALAIGLYFFVRAGDKSDTRSCSNYAAMMKRERLRLNPKYANSIKCKYCESYNSSGFCHIYPSGTTPDDACERFSLPLFASMGRAIEAAEGREFTRRPDGTYMIDLDNASK